MEKKIEVVEVKASEILFAFGNPRKVLKSKKKKGLKDSLDNHGDFGIFVIDENNNVIAGNKRIGIIQEEDPDRMVLCKRLIGYSNPELRAINIKANTHAGEWDIDKLAEWTADLSIDLDFNIATKDADDRKIKDMELIRYERYDYVMIVCKNEIDYLNLVRKFGIEDKKVPICSKRKIKARAIWYNEIEEQIINKPSN